MRSDIERIATALDIRSRLASRLQVSDIRCDPPSEFLASVTTTYGTTVRPTAAPLRAWWTHGEGPDTTPSLTGSVAADNC